MLAGVSMKNEKHEMERRAFGDGLIIVRHNSAPPSADRAKLLNLRAILCSKGEQPSRPNSAACTPAQLKALRLRRIAQRDGWKRKNTPMPIILYRLRPANRAFVKSQVGVNDGDGGNGTDLAKSFEGFTNS
jgi:hypothetical protein